MAGVCQLRIEPEEIGVATTKAEKVSRYAKIKAQLMGAVVKDAPPPMREVCIRPAAPILYEQADAHVTRWAHRQAVIQIKSSGKESFVDHSPTINMIIAETASFYFVTRNDILSQRRTPNVVKPRQVAMCLAKTLTLRSLPEIGRRFGGRDHTTVLHAVRKIERLIQEDPGLAEEIEALKRALLWRPA